MISIRRAIPADAARLADFAAATFRDAFAQDNRPEDMALYLSRAYGVAQQSAELADPSIVTLLAYADDSLAGYAQIRGGEAPSCIAAVEATELWRFYVAQGWHGRGVAQGLMSGVTEAARARGARTLWLGVWERNQRAQAFYRKAGFRDVGSQVFVLGTDGQTDRVMSLTL